MGKRRSSIDPAQMGFTFEPPKPALGEAELAGLDRIIAAKVALVLREDGRSRFEIGSAMSELLDDEVTKLMLDAYAAESREQHNISASRLLALIAVTQRYDILDGLMRRIGASVLVGDELNTARLGHLRAQQKALQAEIRRIEGAVTPIERGAGRK